MWRAKCDAIEKDVLDHKASLDSTRSETNHRHSNLSADVHKLAAILRENSLAREPTKLVGTKAFTPGLGGNCAPTAWSVTAGATSSTTGGLPSILSGLPRSQPLDGGS